MRVLMLMGTVLASLGLAGPLEGTLWSLEQTGLKQPPTLTLYQGKAYGYSGCNRYNTTYRLRAGQISFGRVGITRMFCSKPQQQAEDGLLAMLRQSPSYQLQDGKLVLKSKAETLSFSGPGASLQLAKPAQQTPANKPLTKPAAPKPAPKPVEVKPVEVKPPKPPAPMVKAIQVGPSMVNCTPTDITQCLLVRDNETQPWVLLAEPIEGFEFLEGFQHGVRVEISPDGTKYKLLRLLGQKPSATRLRIMEISPQQVDCQGMVTQQKCLQVRSNHDEFWQNFFDPIEGFEYQEGKAYTLLIEVNPVENPPMDASKEKYKLVRILEVK